MKPIETNLIATPAQTKWYCAPQAEKWLLMTADLISLAAAFALSGIFLFPLDAGEALATSNIARWWHAQDVMRVQAFVLLMIITVASFWAMGHYTKRRPYSNEVREVINVCVILVLIDAAMVFFGKVNFARAALLLTWALAPWFIVLTRTSLKFLLIRAGGWIRPLVVVGWGENAVETALAFEGEKLMGYSLLAFLVPSDREKVDLAFNDCAGRRVPSISLGSSPETTLTSLGGPHVVLALEQGGIDTYQDLIQELGRRARSIQIVPSMRGLPVYGMEVNHFFAHEVLLLTVRNNLARRLPQFIKRAFDISVSLLVLIAASPLLAWIALKVSSSGRPIFYGHRRQGQHNRSFACYKFRTMATNADKLLQELLLNDPDARAEWERDFKLKNDPRITPIGHFLRRTSLDELPQLWNVLKGDMSLVGPRPVVAAELTRYGNQVDYYLEAKPGITGLWQISGRNDVTYETRVYLDSWYVKNWSLFTDIVILFRTVAVIFRRDGAY